MRTVAVISEFNPFHNGHRYCMESIRRDLGQDTCIIALMNGNYTQRGDVAIADKFTRAAAAVRGGVDLVLEIPFPFSVSSAEYYATAGVRLAASLGVVDTLAFGSECGDITRLTAASVKLTSQEFTRSLRQAMQEDESLGHARTTERVFAALYGEEEADLLRHPNNILALRYLAANAALPHPLAAHTVKRVGRYHAATLAEGASATAIRRELNAGNVDEALAAVPEGVAELLRKELEAGHAPASLSRLGNIFLSFFRLGVRAGESDLLGRMHSAAIRAADFEEFTTLVATKRYTHAHLRRAMWHRLLGITSADLCEPVAYTQVLAMNATGRAALRKASRTSAIPILTKPADGRSFTGAAARQVAVSQRADLLYPLAMPRPSCGDASLKAAPYRE